MSTVDIENFDEDDSIQSIVDDADSELKALLEKEESLGSGQNEFNLIKKLVVKKFPHLEIHDISSEIFVEEKTVKKATQIDNVKRVVEIEVTSLVQITLTLPNDSIADEEIELSETLNDHYFYSEKELKLVFLVRVIQDLEKNEIYYELIRVIQEDW